MSQELLSHIEPNRNAKTAVEHTMIKLNCFILCKNNDICLNIKGLHYKNGLKLKKK